MEAYDAGLVNHRDPVNVKFRNQAEEKMKLHEAEQYVDPAKAEEGMAGALSFTCASLLTAIAAAKNAGNEFFKQENWGEAIRSYSEAIKRNPKGAVYYSNRAISYIKVREYALALKDADKCLELDPSFLKGWVRKGMAHHYLKEYYKALEAYDKGMKVSTFVATCHAPLTRARSSRLTRSTRSWLSGQSARRRPLRACAAAASLARRVWTRAGRSRVRVRFTLLISQRSTRLANAP